MAQQHVLQHCLAVRLLLLLLLLQGAPARKYCMPSRHRRTLAPPAPLQSQCNSGQTVQSMYDCMAGVPLDV
jgi:hypothetical protein